MGLPQKAQETQKAEPQRLGLRVRVGLGDSIATKSTEGAKGFPNLDGMSERQLLMLTLMEMSEVKAELRATATLLLRAQEGLSQREYDEGGIL